MQSDKTSNELLDPLTPSQREAVEHIDGPLLILAGPGSGKTRVIMHRIANLLRHGVSSRRILALTFTNKAADEMRLRLERLAPREEVWMGTFHRFCARLLRHHASLVGLKENYSIYDMQDSTRALKQTLIDAGIDLTHTSQDSIASAISWAKHEGVTPDNYVARSGSALGGIVQRVYPEFQKQLLLANAVDFDDLLLHVSVMLRENPPLRQALDERFQYILVDEYQDTNLAQYTIVRALSQDYPNLAVAGDPDQSIYGWRGANLDNILDFEHDFPNVGVVRLEQNYRSTPNILRVADQLISYNVRRKEKTLFTDRPEGTPVRLVIYPTGKDEADGLANFIAQEVACGRRRLRDFAVFYRVNALTRVLESSLMEYNIPYHIVRGTAFWDRKEIKDVLAYLNLINNPSNNEALRRIINTPPRKIGKKTIERLTEHANRYGQPLLDAARQCGEIESMTKAAASAVKNFVAMYDGLRAGATNSLTDIVQDVLVESKYHDWLFNSESEEDQDRLANIEELLTNAQEFDEQHDGKGSLEEFLEEKSLVADIDDWSTESDRVTLMTLHAAKGLEFPVVFIVAVEQGFLPHERKDDRLDGEEEERRLLFVGITRAEEELQLSLTQYRTFRGSRRTVVPSSFLMELPREDMETIEPERFSVGERWESDDWSDDEYAQDDPDYVDFGEPSDTASHLFKRGEVVEHPEYGMGEIVSIRGTGRNRSATIRFYDAGDEHKFRLSHAPLVPVASDD